MPRSAHVYQAIQTGSVVLHSPLTAQGLHRAQFTYGVCGSCQWQTASRGYYLSCILPRWYPGCVGSLFNCGTLRAALPLVNHQGGIRALSLHSRLYRVAHNVCRVHTTTLSNCGAWLQVQPSVNRCNTLVGFCVLHFQMMYGMQYMAQRLESH